MFVLIMAAVCRLVGEQVPEIATDLALALVGVAFVAGFVDAIAGGAG